MGNSQKNPRLVGHFVRKRRESLGLSQRALGLLFSPPVTTQFISNVERGVTPLPPIHVATLTKALGVPETELLALLEREFTLKLSERIGRQGDPQGIPLAENLNEFPQLTVTKSDYEFMSQLYEAYRHADPRTRQAFATVCESMLQVSKHATLIKKPELPELKEEQ
jgi:transcriptional regulator with XRE-family HTH domain